MLVARLVHLLRNLPLSASLLSHHLHRGPAKAISVLLRRAPHGLRTRLGALAASAGRPDLAALALAADGRGAEAVELLTAALRRAPSSGSSKPESESELASESTSEAGSASRSWAVRLGRIAEAAATVHEPELASRALHGIPPQDRDPVHEALVAADQGHLSRALDLVQDRPGRAAGRLAGRLRGEVEVVQAHALRDDLAQPANPAQPADPARADDPAREQHSTGACQQVLHVVTNALPERQAGYTLRTHGIVTAQRARGVDAQVVSRLGFPVDTGWLGAAREVEVDGVPYHRLLPRTAIPAPGRARQDLAARELDALVQRTGTQLLHAHSMHANAQSALRVGRARGLPVVYEARGFLEETWRTDGGSADSDFYRWSKDTETLCMTAADTVVTLAEAMRQDIVDRGVDPDRVVVVPNAVPTSFCAPLPPGMPTRTRLGIPGDAVVFGTVSTLNHYEGLQTAIAALQLIDDPALRLLVVGDGPALRELQALAEPLGERVVFTGRVPHALVREHLAAIDVFVVPRAATPVTALVPPLKPLEALAVGIPVLASDLPPLVEIVRPGEFGEVARADDPSAWADQMASLGYAPDHVRTLGEHASRFVVRERTWAAAAHRYDTAYSSAVGH